MKKLFAFLSLSIIYISANAVTIYGNGGDYIDKTLVLKAYTDEIAYAEQTLDSLVVDSLGDFEFQFEVSAVTSVFLDLGIYHAVFFVEPSKTYLLDLPNYKERTEADKFNPYFKPSKIQLMVRDVDSTDINRQIAGFETTYDYSYVKCSLFQGQMDSITSEINSVETIYAEDKNEFFHQYRQYKYALMVNMNERLAPALGAAYMAKLPVSYENIAFWEAFNAIFRGFFDIFGNYSPEQTAMDKAIYAGNYEQLSAYLQERFGLTNPVLRELVILKGLYDAYYSERRNAPYILKLLEKWQDNVSDYNNRQIWQNAFLHLKSLAPQAEAYNFKLQDEKGKSYQLSDFKGKYVYLNFCNTRITLSKKDFGILERYGETYKKDLVVVNLFTDYSRGDMSIFVKGLNSKNVNLFWNSDRNLITKYQLINIPTYYLIDRDGKLLLAPAPTPDENFEQKFENILRKEKAGEVKNEVDDIWK
ncbi:hypothetical protein FACS189434_10700 [Bacteroidia bacterium]|nr:hypothetical protein FACS189434_10700 [Bacteroidia bacterium]